ncbi:hypothetical protein DFR28_1023 [Arenicella xantha]|uniref:Uncharacterized protein n=1 Tax=Arenicella xantha TaxID=644221 RepID=A0A395JIQ0_9GAMM|nr:hypothetical protein DFR28_1023 [Arenicella xantha]
MIYMAALLLNLIMMIIVIAPSNVISRGYSMVTKPIVCFFFDTSS